MWNGLTFNFETILQAHDSPIRSLRWSHNDTWMISGDDTGVIKYWQSNMNNLKSVHVHKECVRDLTFSPSDTKFASCSDDGTIKIWSFADATEESSLTGTTLLLCIRIGSNARIKTATGHGWDVKTLDWHPTKGVLASGSKDNLAKLWDPKTGRAVATLHGHKNTVTKVQWNMNGNWLLTGCRDQLVRVYDIRTMKELQVFKGHRREVHSICWHPFHENMFVSGSYEGAIMYWLMGYNDALAVNENAHTGAVFTLAWHPLGHLLASGSNDHSVRFWTRNRPGDAMNDVYHMSRQEAERMGLEADESQPEPRIHQSDGALPGLATANRSYNNSIAGRYASNRR